MSRENDSSPLFSIEETDGGKSLVINSLIPSQQFERSAITIIFTWTAAGDTRSICHLCRISRQPHAVCERNILFCLAYKQIRTNNGHFLTLVSSRGYARMTHPSGAGEPICETRALFGSLG
uniref:Uncharacterized protein n=1 Tax=Oryza sativa subsp. japonica TaxID=39947 RepID=Q69MT9_ORYSJ|nr:hypothetical protein [Oryza sativa Japonica Group]